MTGIANVMLTGFSNGSPNANFTATLYNVFGTTGARTVSLTLAGDGTVTFSGNSSSSASSNWFLPTTTGVGSSWWVQFVDNGTTLTSHSYTSGAWTKINSSLNVQWHNSSPSTEGSGSANVYFSPDGGLTVYSSGSVSWDVGYSP